MNVKPEISKCNPHHKCKIKRNPSVWEVRNVNRHASPAGFLQTLALLQVVVLVFYIYFAWRVKSLQSHRAVTWNRWKCMWKRGKHACDLQDMATTNGEQYKARKPRPLQARTTSWSENCDDIEVPGTPKTPRTSTTPGSFQFINITYSCIKRRSNIFEITPVARGSWYNTLLLVSNTGCPNPR